ncbi:FAD-dependent monooxygenase [Actinomadura luteofluorescens]|uniref:FAD-dependent monooxygenase n=1 Tax=Actinomadura luteofluorescens TaxID=46163 RepID=UPI0030CDBE21
MSKSVLISGASIAGPSLAYWLARYGYDVTVVERAEAIRPGGQAVDFRGEVHMRVLEKMGVLDEIRLRRTDAGPLDLIDAAGRTRVSLPDSFTGGDVEIHRGDLAELLYELTRDSAHYVFGDSITSMTETADGVHVTFERGAPRTFDLVVGADGLHSNVRRLAFGEEGQFVRDSGYHVAIFEAPNRLGVGTGKLYSEVGRGVSVYPTRGGTGANVMCVFADHDLKPARRDQDAQKRALAERFAGMGWHTGSLMEDVWDAPYFYCDSISMVRMDSWTKGRVALLGDAGYGATCGGMGTGLAVVCAYVLAGELAAAGGDHRAAFAAYEKSIKKFTTACQRVAGGAGPFFAPKSERALRRRATVYRLLTAGPFIKILNKLTTQAATAIKLKEYPEPSSTPHAA